VTVTITVLCLLLSQLSAVTTPGEGFQIKGTDAVAAAIWAVVAHWEGQPQDAIVAAVHYGGDTDTIACMAGALTLFSQQDELTVTVQATYHRRCTRGGAKPTLVGWMCLPHLPCLERGRQLLGLSSSSQPLPDSSVTDASNLYLAVCRLPYCLMLCCFSSNGYTLDCVLWHAVQVLLWGTPKPAAGCLNSVLPCCAVL
jgi:hypothetical protein